MSGSVEMATSFVANKFYENPTVSDKYNLKVHAFHVATTLAVAAVAGLFFQVLSLPTAFFCLTTGILGRLMVMENLSESEEVVRKTMNEVHAAAKLLGAKQGRTIRKPEWDPNQWKMWGYVITKNYASTFSPEPKNS